MRIATYNIRNVRALDWNSLWLRRRRSLARVLESHRVDVWCLQEAYRAQIKWFNRTALPSYMWSYEAAGRNRTGGGEAVPVYWRSNQLEVTVGRTRWFGPSPATPGSKIEGSHLPRIATIVDATMASGREIRIANTHLDERSPERRRASLAQLVEWLHEGDDNRPVVVVGDLNCVLGSDDLVPLVDAGLRPALSIEDGPTANEFGRREGQQIDHVFVSAEWEVTSVFVATDAGLVSDHYPVIADLSIE